MENLDSFGRDLMQDIRDSEEWRDRHIKQVRDVVARYHGVAYSDRVSTEHDPENPIFEIVSLYMPQLAFQVPYVSLGGLQSPYVEDEIPALKHGINRWVRDVKFTRFAEKMAIDTLFSHGVSICSVAPRPGYYEEEDPPYWPQLNRLPLNMVGWDSLAKSWEDRQFTFHMVSVNHEKLIERARLDRKLPEDQREGWILSAVEAMTPGIGTQEVYEGGNPGRARKEVVYYEIYVPGERINDENTPERGYHGAVYTYAYDSASKAQQIREPRDWWGVRAGPYTLWGIYTVPDSSMPLSPVIATIQQQKDLGSVLRANNTATKNWKRIILADDENLVQDIKDGKHDHVFHHPNLMEKTVQVHEYGGVSDQSLAQEMRLRDALERVLGISDAMRGNVTGDATATENQIAASGAASRQGFIVKKFYEAAEMALEGPLWFLRNDDTIKFPLGQEAAEETSTPNPVFLGGQEDDRVRDLDDLEVSIEIGSMGRTTQGQREQRALSYLNTVALLGNLGQLGFVDIDGLAKDIASDMGFARLPERVSGETAQAIVALQLQQQELPPNKSEPAQQPRLSKTIAASRPPQTPTSVGGAANSRLANKKKEA